MARWGHETAQLVADRPHRPTHRRSAAGALPLAATRRARPETERHRASGFVAPRTSGAGHLNGPGDHPPAVRQHPQEVRPRPESASKLAQQGSRPMPSVNLRSQAARPMVRRVALRRSSDMTPSSARTALMSLSSHLSSPSRMCSLPIGTGLEPDRFTQRQLKGLHRRRRDRSHPRRSRREPGPRSVECGICAGQRQMPLVVNGIHLCGPTSRR